MLSEGRCSNGWHGRQLSEVWQSRRRYATVSEQYLWASLLIPTTGSYSLRALPDIQDVLPCLLHKDWLIDWWFDWNVPNRAIIDMHSTCLKHLCWYIVVKRFCNSSYAKVYCISFQLLLHFFWSEHRVKCYVMLRLISIAWWVKLYMQPVTYFKSGIHGELF